MTLAALERLPIEPSAWTLLSGYALDYVGSRDAFRMWMTKRTSLPNFVFDPSPVVAAIKPEVLQPALAMAAWVSANRREAELLTGEADPMRAAERLGGGRRGGALVRQGARGLCARPPADKSIRYLDIL